MIVFPIIRIYFVIGVERDECVTVHESVIAEKQHFAAVSVSSLFRVIHLYHIFATVERP